MTGSRDYNLENRIDAIFKGRYELLGKLGSGGMGMVFLVQANDLGRKHYALKVIDKKRPENAGVDVYVEIQILKGLKHPNIVSIYEALEDSDYVYIIQEFIDGKTLAELRDDPQAYRLIDTDTVRLWMIDVADAMSYIHRMGIIHRDIKPGNIMIDSDGIAKLIDFGIARRISTVRKRKNSSTVGSAPYSPLERLQGSADGVQTDIYAYGTTFYSLLRRRIPSVSGREINTLRTSNQSIEPYYMNAYRTMVGDLENIEDEGIRNLIRSCVEIDPEKRVRDFNSVRYSLQSIEHVEQEVAYAKRRHGAVSKALVAMLIAGILCTGLGIVQMRRDHAHNYEKMILEADNAYASSDYHASEDAARKAIEFDPNNEAGYVAKYKAETAYAYEMNDDSAYEKLLNEAENDSIDLPKLKENLNVSTYVANACYETGQFSKAISELEGREDLGDDQLLLLGEALYENGENSKALSYLEKMASDVPQRYYLEGLINEKTDYAKAISMYEKVLKTDDQEPGFNDLQRKALSQIARIYTDRGDFENAIKVITDTVKDIPELKESAKINIMLMDCYYRSGNYADAISQADTVIAKYPNAGAYAIKCSSQAETGNYQDALNTIEKWEDDYQDDARPHIQRALIYNRIAGGADSDAERRDRYPDFIRVYEEELRWLQDHNELNDEFLRLEGSYLEAKRMLEQMEAGL